MMVKLAKQILRSRPKTFIFIAVLIFVNVVLYVYCSSYQKPRLSSLQNTWFQQRKAKEQGLNIDAPSIYRQGKADLSTWRNRIAPKKDFARVVSELFELAGNNALSVGGITYKPAQVKGENLLSYAISLDVYGKYSAIKSFLADVMCSREFLIIDHISLNNNRPTEELVDLKVHLTVYFRMEEK
jgi:type IV pilus assembly protein PilO